MIRLSAQGYRRLSPRVELSISIRFKGLSAKGLKVCQPKDYRSVSLRFRDLSAKDIEMSVSPRHIGLSFQG